MYNAPKIARPKSEADEARYLDKEMFAEIFVAHTKDRLLVGCKDPFGALSVKKLLNRLWATYLTSQIQSINVNGDGGAGIGTRMMFNQCIGLYAAVDPKVKTMVCCTFSISKSTRVTQNYSKSLHLTISVP